MIEVSSVFIIITTINYFFHAKLRFDASPILHFKAKFRPWMPFSRFSREEDEVPWICSVSPDQKSEFFIQSFHFIISILFTNLFSFQSYLSLKPHYFSLFWHPVIFFIVLAPCGNVWYFSLFWHPVIFFIVLAPCDIYHFSGILWYFSLFWHPVVFFIVLASCDIFHCSGTLW